MEYQLRIYDVRNGEMDAWIDEWKHHVAPLRQAKGFEIVGAWRGVDERSFVWILGYDGDLATADDVYYGSPDRQRLDPDPARHIERGQHRMLRRVL